MTSTATESAARKTEAKDYAEAFFDSHKVDAAGVRKWALESSNLPDEDKPGARGAISRKVLDAYGAAFPLR